ncbi:K(+)-transporting ATPase subunit F [soil metagenome]
MTEYGIVERSIVIDAPADRIMPHLIDFHRWVAWSPWEGLDPDLKRTYAGPDGAVGASYAWDGNRKAGAGSMTATSIAADSFDVALSFTRPFTSQSLVHFALEPTESETTVVWTLKSPKTAMSRVFGLFMNMDKMIGNDLDKGLAALKRVVEA